MYTEYICRFNDRYPFVRSIYVHTFIRTTGSFIRTMGINLAATNDNDNQWHTEYAVQITKDHHMLQHRLWLWHWLLRCRYCCFREGCFVCLSSLPFSEANWYSDRENLDRIHRARKTKWSEVLLAGGWGNSTALDAGCDAPLWVPAGPGESTSPRIFGPGSSGDME
jgi:hypothetical protein